MEVQQDNSQQIKNKILMRLGCGDLENLTFGKESRNYINWKKIFRLLMLSWAVKTETAENTNQGP